jgi:DNA-binding PadR family transcriptional regulator
MAIDADRELLILGLLARGPISAYELNRSVKMHAPLYRSFGRGNLYAQLQHLDARGLVESDTAPAERGPRATKAVYRLSAFGRKRFDELLTSVFNDIQVADAAIEVACVLAGRLSRGRALELMGTRLRLVAAQGKRLERLLGKPEERSAGGQLSMMHTVARLRSEEAWLRDSIALLRNPKWQPEWRETATAPRRSQ